MSASAVASDGFGIRLVVGSSGVRSVERMGTGCMGDVNSRTAVSPVKLCAAA